MYAGGLFLQLAFFSTFLAIVLYLQTSRELGLRGNTALTPIFALLYITISLMYGRNVFRVVESLQGW